MSFYAKSSFKLSITFFISTKTFKSTIITFFITLNKYAGLYLCPRLKSTLKRQKMSIPNVKEDIINAFQFRHATKEFDAQR
jgi:3-deoxy-D-arabino-heptulosonate 7-phosphate (DAHP) synthase class II